MQFVKPDINIDFVGKRKIAFSISLAMILISIASLVIHGGPKYGIDFAGGTLVQIKFSEPVSLKNDQIRSCRHRSREILGPRVWRAKRKRVSYPHRQVCHDFRGIFPKGAADP